MTFRAVPIGRQFLWQGEVYTKIAVSMARNPRNEGCVFPGLGEHEVELLPNRPPSPEDPAQPANCS